MIEKWVDRLFKRFHEIYGVRSGIIEGTRKDWEEIIKDKTGEQILSALEACKEDVDVLVTLSLFKQLLSESKKKLLIPLPTEVEIDKPKNITINYSPQELLSFDEKSAVALLTYEQQYDRMRLFLEREAINVVNKNASSISIPLNKPAESSKVNKPVKHDWY